MQPNRQQRPPPYNNYEYSAVPPTGPAHSPYPPQQQGYAAPPLHTPMSQQHPTSSHSHSLPTSHVPHSNLGATKISSFNQAFGVAPAAIPNSYGLSPGVNSNTGYRPPNMQYNAATSPTPNNPINQHNPDIWASQTWQDLQGSAAGQLGLQFTNHALLQGQQMVSQNIDRWINLPSLKYYFNVNNAYVASKLRLLLFPYRHKSWSRLVKRSEHDGHMEGYKSPREDINAPDLYIPSMSFVTYILLVGIFIGQQDKFHPEVLGITSTTALFVIMFEVLFVKFGCYLLNVMGDVSWLDLVAYCGYQFVALLFVEIARLTAPIWAVYTIFAYTTISFGFFMLRSLRYIVQPESTHTVQTDTRRSRIRFLFIVVVVQIAMAWLLC